MIAETLHPLEQGRFQLELAHWHFLFSMTCYVSGREIGLWSVGLLPWIPVSQWQVVEGVEAGSVPALGFQDCVWPA